MALKNKDLLFVIKVQNQARAALNQLRGDLRGVGTAGNAGVAGIRAQERALEALRKKAIQTRQELQRLATAGNNRGRTTTTAGAGNARGGGGPGSAGTQNLAALARSARAAATNLDRVARSRAGRPGSPGGGRADQGLNTRESNIALRELATNARRASTALERIARQRPPAGGGGGTGAGAAAGAAAGGRFGGIAAIAGGAAAVATAVGYAKLSDEYKNLNARISLTTESLAQQQSVFGRVTEIANGTRQSLEGTVTTYYRMAQAGKNLGLEQEKIYRATELVSKAVTVSGASADAAKGALIQLGQGLGSGTLRGEELNSVLEQTPRLAEALAAGLGMKSVTALRTFAQEGKLTSEAVITALLSQGEKLDAEFAKFPVTIGQSMEVLRNNVTVAIGEIENSTGATAGISAAILEIGNALRNPEVMDGLKALGSAVGTVALAAAKALVFLAKNLDTVIKIITVFITVLGARYIATLTAAAAAAWANVTANVALAAAATGASTAMQVLAIRAALAGRALLLAFGGPIGVIVLALAGSMYLLKGRIDSLRQASAQYSKMEAQANDVRDRAEAAARELATATGAAAVKARENAAATREEAQALLDNAKAAIAAARAKAQVAVANAKASGLYDGGFFNNVRLGVETTLGIGTGPDILRADADLKATKAAADAAQAALDAFSFSAGGGGGGGGIGEAAKKGAGKAKSAVDELKTALEGLQSTYDPLRAKEREFGEQTKQLAKASSLSDAALKKLGFTREDIARIVDNAKRKMAEELDIMFDLNRQYGEQVRVLGVVAEDRDIEQQMIALENKAREQNTVLTTAQTAAYRAQLVQLREFQKLDEARSTIKGASDQAQDELAVVGQIGAARERALQVVQFTNGLRRAGVKNEEQIVALGEEYTRILQTQAQIQARDDMAQRLADLDTEIRLAGVLEQSRERAASILAYENYLKEQGLAGTEEGVRLLNTYTEALNQSAQAEAAARADWRSGIREGLQELTQQWSNMRDAARGFITDTFTSLSDTLQGFLQTGKLNISSFIQGIGQNLIKIGVNGLLSRATGALDKLFGGTGEKAMKPTSLLDQYLQANKSIPVTIQNVSALGGLLGNNAANDNGVAGAIANIVGGGAKSGGKTGGAGGGLLDVARSVLEGNGGGDAKSAGKTGGLLGVASGILGAGGSGAGAGGLLGVAASILGGAGGGGGIMGLLSGILGGGGGAGGLGGLLGFGLSLFKNGGIMTEYGQVPIRKYSGGGIARSPQLAMFGEGSVPEAYVPVPSGRIPVEMRGSAGGGQVINMNINTPDANSFRKSRGQIASEMASELSRASGRNS